MRLCSQATLIAVVAAAMTVAAPAAPHEDAAAMDKRLLSLFGGSLSSVLKSLKSELNNVITVTTSQLPNVQKTAAVTAINWTKYGIFNAKKKLSNKGYPFSKGNTQSWSTFKANGVNLGGWMETEIGQQPALYALAPSAIDEWTLCEALGDQCGPTFENHYATWYSKSDIDTLAKYGINTLRVPTHYSAWIDWSGSELYHGNQQTYLANLLDYAASKYNMKIIIGLHSLPGGINSLDIGEAFGHKAWFYNATLFDLSMQAVNTSLAWIAKRPQKAAFALSPLNEAGDDLAYFGTSQTLSDNAAAWVATYFKTAIAAASAISSSTTIVIQDCFLGSSYWAAVFPAGSNIVIDSHIYYFSAAGIYSQYVAPAICGQASAAGNSRFPTFIGEWSLQVNYNNTLAGRKTLLQTQQYAWANSNGLAGGAFWSARFNGTNPVNGEGTQKNYWTYLDFIADGIVNVGGTLDSVYCS